MPQVEIRDRKIDVGGKGIPLISGEVHYWRLAPPCWQEILTRVREMGLEVVATYVCWDYHEHERGKFDFTGKTEPQRNLIGFLDLVQEMGFWIVIRPGPYIYSEWKNAGVPDHVAPYHRLSTEYQSAARVWIEAVTRAIAPYLATRGGPILCLQADNEMDLFTHWFEDELGLRGKPGLFHRFLAERYGDVSRLNAAWGTSYSAIEEAQAVAEAPFPSERGRRVAMMDYWRFQHWTVRECVRWHVEAYRQAGVDVPIYHNFYFGGDVQNWRELAGVADFLGIDLYPGAEFERQGYPQTQRLFLDDVRYQRSLSPIPYIAEFECGVWHGVHESTGIPTPGHYRLLSFSALLAGAAGWNWYMLVNRDNWYYSPIQEWGRVRGELFGVFRDIVRVVRELDPPSLTKLTDTAVVLDPLQIAADKILRQNPVLDALYDADIDYETFDLQTGRIEKPLVFYAGAHWLERADQARLVRYVEEGGTLVVFKSSPRLDENLEPLNLLEIREPASVLSPLGKRVQVKLGGEQPVIRGALFEYEGVAAPITAVQTVGPLQVVENSDVLALRYRGKEFTVGYVAERGKGRLVVLGLDPNPALVLAIHHWLGVPTYAHTEAPEVRTALFRREGSYYLVATNNGKEERRAPVSISPLASHCRLTDLWTGEVRTAHSTVIVSLAPKSGNAWRLEPLGPRGG
ncbi:MAG: beta-galactosidase [Planctomycetota bacterium]